MTTRLVVVGNGMVGHRLLEEFATLQPPDLEITVLGEETRPAYDRVHLSEFFSGRTAAGSAPLQPRWRSTASSWPAGSRCAPD